jgi:hypothetical protein
MEEKDIIEGTVEIPVIENPDDKEQEIVKIEEEGGK